MLHELAKMIELNNFTDKMNNKILEKKELFKGGYLIFATPVSTLIMGNPQNILWAISKAVKGFMDNLERHNDPKSLDKILSDIKKFVTFLKENEDTSETKFTLDGTIEGDSNDTV